MTSNRQQPRDSARKDHLFIVLGIAAFLLLFGTVIYMASTLERLEDKLAYKPPAAIPGPTAGDTPLRDIPEGVSVIYVPVYSHIYAAGAVPVLLETTLSIRNTDPDRMITISSIRYFDTKGQLVQEYLDADLQLGPLESTEVLVENHDSRGGSGANFLVAWKSDTPVYSPLAEAVMVGRIESQDISILSTGKQLDRRVDRLSSGTQVTDE